VPVFRTIQFAISGDLSVPIFYQQPITQFLVGYLVKPDSYYLLQIAIGKM